MIKLHRLNDSEISINADLIESVEAGPNTKIVLSTGNLFIVKETVDEVIAKIKEYKQSILQKQQKNGQEQN